MAPSSESSDRPGLLFLCVANSARSQIAEGWARALAPPGTPIFSAGSEPGTLNPHAVTVMGEVGLDISAHHSKGLDAIALEKIQTVVTLCSDEVCPTLPGSVERLHWPFPDPAGQGKTAAEELKAFRAARDAIGERLRDWLTERY